MTSTFCVTDRNCVAGADAEALATGERATVVLGADDAADDAADDVTEGVGATVLVT